MENESFKYLDSENHYSDLYDRFTVARCRYWEKCGGLEDYKKLKDKSKENKIKRDLKLKVIIPTAIYFIKGERYAQKSDTIREWMSQDREKDELLASAKPPEVQCLICGSDLIPNFKNFHDGWPDKKDRVLFMYDCPKGCLPRRAFFDNGEERRPKSRLCPKCNSDTEEKNKREGNIITTIYACLKCGHRDKDILDLGEKPKPEKIDRNFTKDRQKFCLSDKEGGEYIASKTRLDDFSKSLKEMEEKEKVRKGVPHIKKITVAELQKLLAAALKKEEYINLELSKPEIKKDVIIEFTVQDNKTDRGEYDSRIQLQRILKKKLETTNWLLMNDGVSYRLGILTGRLKGLEPEEDLLKLIHE